MQAVLPLSQVLRGLVGEAHATDPRHISFTLKDTDGCGLCFACAWEVLLDSQQLVIRKRTLALSMLQMLNSMEDVSFLSKHGFASASLGFCAQVLGGADEPLAHIVMDLASALQAHPDKASCLESIRFQLQTLTWQQSRFVMLLLGRLLCLDPDGVAPLLVQSYAPLVEHLLVALQYPHEDARTSSTFVFLNLAAVDAARESLLSLCGPRLVCAVVELISKSTNEAVYTNAIALLHSLAIGAGVELVRTWVPEQKMATVLKSRLLVAQEPLRALVMQTIARLCSDSADSVGLYLEEGVADFVIEAASSKASALVLGASVSLLQLLADHRSFCGVDRPRG